MKIKRIIYVALLQLTFMFTKAQCPQIYDSNNNLQSHPYWISCSGGPYTLNFQAPTSWGTYTLSWGDATPDFLSGFYTANSIISHTYSAIVDTFIVTLNVPSLNCTLTGVVVMELPVNAMLTIPVGGTNAACAPASLSFSNVSTNVSQTTHFQYNFGDNSPLANFTYTNANTAVSHMYLPNTVTCQTQVTLDAWNYCTFTTTSVAVLTPIDIYSKDIPNISVSSNVLCWPSNTFTFSNTSTLNCVPQGNNYPRRQYWRLGNYWAFNSFQDSIIPWQIVPPPAPVTVAFPFMGNFTVWLKDSSVCGVDSSNITVNIFNAPVASLVAPPAPLCQNTPITFTNNSTVGVFYKFDFGSGPPGFFNFPAGPQSFTYPAPGTYTVRLVAYLPFSNTCSDTSTVVINILPSPIASFTFSPNGGCSPLNNVTFTDTSVGSLTWNWDFGNANTSTLQVPPPQNYTATSVVSLSITTAANTCPGIIQQTVSVNPLPVASFSVNSVCVNSAVQFTDQSTSLLPISSYTWNFGDGSPLSFVQNPIHTYTTSAIFNITLTVSNGQCTGTYVGALFIINKPTANFIATPTVGCSALNVSFNNTSTGTTVFLWEFGDGSPNSAVNSPTHAFVNPLTTNQTYTVTLVATNVSGCMDSIKASILVLGKPNVGYTVSPKAGCWPLTLSFTNTSVSYTSSAWNFANGNTSALTNPSQTFTNSSGSPTTLFPVKLVITGANGCKDSVSQTMTLFPRPLAAFIADTPACSPKVITFTNTSTGAITYAWNFGSSGTSTLTNPSFQFVNLTASPQSSLTQLVAQNSNGCYDTLKTNIVIYPKPNINITVLPDSGCAPLNVIFPTVNGLSTYSWTLGNGQFASTASVTMTYLNLSILTRTYTAQLIGSNAKGCSDTATHKIRVFPSPTALFDATPLTVYLPDPGTNLVNLSTGATSYTWSFGDGATSTSSLPVHAYTVANSYQIKLIAKNTFNCLDSFKLGSKIVVLGETRFQMPNAFTPNTNGSPGSFYNPADLSNDVFHPVVKGVTDFKFTIYSRWGEILFDTVDPTQGWDGYYKGKLCKQDVYVWKIYAKFYDDQTINKTGDVTLLR